MSFKCLPRKSNAFFDNTRLLCKIFSTSISDDCKLTKYPLQVVFFIMLLLTSWSNIPFAYADDVNIVQINNESAYTLHLIKHKNKTEWTVDLPNISSPIYYCDGCSDVEDMITIDPQQGTAISITDSPIYDLYYTVNGLSCYSLGWIQRSDYQMNIYSVEEEGKTKITADLYEVSQDVKNPQQLCHDGLITITQKLVSELLWKKNPPKKHLNIAEAISSTVLNTKITPERIKHHFDSKYLPHKPYVVKNKQPASNISRRIDTFFATGLSESLQPHKESFISQRMFFTGKWDQVQCIVCYKKLHGWEKNDNVKQVHARRSPDCALSTHPELYTTLHKQYGTLNNIKAATIFADGLKKRVDEVIEQQQTSELTQALYYLSLPSCGDDELKNKNAALIIQFAQSMQDYLKYSKIKLNDLVFQFDERAESILRYLNQEIEFLEYTLEFLKPKIELLGNKEKHEKATTQLKKYQHFRDAVIKAQRISEESSSRSPEADLDSTDTLEFLNNAEDVMQQTQKKLEEACTFYKNKPHATEISQLRNEYLTELARFYVIGSIISNLHFIEEPIKNAFDVNLIPITRGFYTDFRILNGLFDNKEEFRKGYKLFPRLGDRLERIMTP